MTADLAPAAPRPVVAVVDAVAQLEGAGFLVHRPFPRPGLDVFDPFLLLDEMGPVDHDPGAAEGAPDHPHRGFETVTYLIDGEFEHRDSTGGHGIIRPGGVQWMTAGAGVVHSEMPSAEFQERGGRLHGFQLWVNLPASHKMTPPRYQERDADAIPEVRVDGATVRIVSGEFGGVGGSAETITPVTYLHVALDAGASLDLPVPADHQVGVYVFDGAMTVSGTATATQQMALLGATEGHVTLASDGGAQALFLAGRPLNEPVARYGPFVMNTREQIIEAFEDHQAGRLGRIAPIDA